MTPEDLRWMAERGHVTLLSGPAMRTPGAGRPLQLVRLANGPSVWLPLATIAAVLFPEEAGR